jgi:DNA-binding transcriptional ArsR family regulator
VELIRFSLRSRLSPLYYHIVNQLSIIVDGGAEMADRRGGTLGPEALDLVARRFRALSDPRRLALLQALFAGEATVRELCRRTGTGQANASKHLALLAAEGLVARRKEGLHAWYRIADASVKELCRVVCGSLERRFARVRARFGA